MEDYLNYKANNLSDAWYKALRALFKYGREIIDGDEKLLELRNMKISVCGNKSDRAELSWYLEKMGSKHFEFVKAIFEKGYYYKNIHSFDGIDQLDLVVKKLKKNPWSKSAIVTLIDPKTAYEHVPCVWGLNFMIRDGRLVMSVASRSMDALKKLPPDLYKLSEIHNQVAKKLKLQSGDFTIFIMSLHVYECEFEKMLNIISEKKWGEHAGSWEKDVKNSAHYVNIEKGYKRFLRFVEKVCRKTTFRKALDLGCGTGIVARHLLSAKITKSVTGIDIAPEMIAVAKKLTPKIGYLVGDAADTALPVNSFDLIVSRGVLLSDLKYSSDKLVREAYRLLNNNGTLILDFIQKVGKTEGDMSREKSIYSIAGVKKMLKKTGFQVISFENKGTKRVNSVYAKKK